MFAVGMKETFKLFRSQLDFTLKKLYEPCVTPTFVFSEQNMYVCVCVFMIMGL